MKIQILTPNEFYSAVYVNGKKIHEDDIGDFYSLFYNMAQALGWESPEQWCYDDQEEDDFTDDYNVFKGQRIWIDGQGCPEEWPIKEY